jgi:hypothetical protein
MFLEKMGKGAAHRNICRKFQVKVTYIAVRCTLCNPYANVTKVEMTPVHLPDKNLK